MSEAQVKTLILETSGRVGIVAVAQGQSILAERHLDERRRHARDLAPAVRDLLHQFGWKPTDIAGVIVDLGPGSYTGLRVGIMSAKAWAYATGCRLIGVPAFPAVALQATDPLEANPEPRRIWVINDAQQNRVYCQRFEITQTPSQTDGPKALTNLSVLPVEQWLAELSAEDWVSGPGLRLHRDKLPPAVKVVAESAWDPRPQALLRLGWDRLLRGESDNVMAVEPLYARRSSAEEMWEKRHGG
ncbi:MAG: tRNA (adenosine(37)-N6)-threonylcarbamoyltransferase complex dimerization subunit type 1 TsaB [Gemmatales bacterium]|nr:tRNA (adenosine(37)-N6)-threonylcarbamoyltransferase complex dimerization subunit type 1 TsaB [Gemmatales bacterium]MDW8385427.1 tRNA (adenosine(37)-N6)-threonylcarbamoyltransferase complex dimerization subunit type 1 TsaB [Gemmatales bacterium]